MRHTTWILLAALLVLTACGGPPDAGTGFFVGDGLDWTDLDGQLPRGQLYAYTRIFGDFDSDLPGRYRRAMAMDPTASFAVADSEAGADAWTTSDDLVRLGALAVWDRGDRLAVINLKQVRAVGPMHLLDRVMARAIARLVGAIQVDPGNAAAWFHLAVFTDVVGDRSAAAQARARFLDLAPPPDARRARLILDEAWTLRDAGRFDQALAWLGVHQQEFDRVRESDHRLPTAVEADLIRGLCHAELGDRNTARAYARRLPDVRVHDRHGYRDSGLLRTWVNVWGALRSRDPDQAAFLLQPVRATVLPAGVAWRCWQDFGLIAEELDDREHRDIFVAISYLHRPFLGFYPTVALRGTDEIMGREGTGSPYLVSYRTWFVGGSLWGYAATRALACQLVDETDDPVVWRQAMSALDACIRRGFHAADARLLRARLNLQRGDAQAAADDLALARLEQVTGRGGEADLAFMRGVSALDAGDNEAALGYLRQCVDAEPDHVRGWQALAVACSYLRRDDEALAAYDRLRALRPDDGVTCFNRGLLHLSRGRRDAATADLNRAAELLDDPTPARRLLRMMEQVDDVELDLAPQPVRLVASGSERALARDLDQQYAEGLVADADDLTPEEAAAWRDLLERRYAEEPSTGHRHAMARQYAHAGDHAAVVDLLAPFWPDDLDRRERDLLLEADRELGYAGRAAALAADPSPAESDDVPTLARAVVILLDHGRQDEARLCFARAMAASPDDPALGDLQQLVR
jgi:tetratricopeptide (TPR) repeat protein